MTVRKPFFQLLFTLILAAGCKENYVPPVIKLGVTALVLDGFINNSPDTTFIRLSHTNKLSDGVNHASVLGARLSIEDASGNTLYNFQQLDDNGVYIVSGMSLDINSKYRLRIFDVDKQYLSDEIPVVKTPPIDSITFEHTGKGVAICSNTHDPLNNTLYYRWEYAETYHYRAAFYSSLKFENGGLTDRPPSESIYDCWKTQNNPELLLATTAKLSQDVVYHNTLRFVDQNGIELSIKYFIALRQFGITKESFNYLENLKKITEQTGSIFDAQPSQLTGNIHSVSNPDEVVLGYLSISTEEKMERYITNDDVQPWKYAQDCEVFEVGADFASIGRNFSEQGLVPLSIDGGAYNAKGIFATTHSCGDCRAFGGVTTKPFFFQ